MKPGGYAPAGIPAGRSTRPEGRVRIETRYGHLLPVTVIEVAPGPKAG